jgi:hypothetical protein
MQEGILDMNVIMDYYNQSVSWRADYYTKWLRFTEDNQFNRQAVIGQAAWLNSTSNSLFQIRATRTPSRNTNSAAGVAIYAYGGDKGKATERAELLQSLTHTNKYESNASPVFSTCVPTPDMPWKLKPVKGHLKGFVFSGKNNEALDGAKITLTGATNKTMTADATGFYGAVDLEPGKYTLTTVSPDHAARTNEIAITAGNVTSQDIVLPRL